MKKSKLVVAVVDNAVIIREKIIQTLGRVFDDVATLEFSNGKELLDALECKESINCIVLDYNLDFSDGAAFCQEIKRKYPNVVIIGYSVIMEARAAFYQAKADFFYDKGSSLKEFIDIMKEALEKAKQFA